MAKETKEVKAENTSQTKEPTLPETLGKITFDVLTALQEESTPAVKQAAIQQAKRELHLWYERQSVEGRQDIARKSRRLMESFKLVAEQCYQDFMQISAQDAI